MAELRQQVLAEAQVLTACGVDALCLENMHDRPYQKRHADPAVVASMTVLADALRQAHPAVPMGIQILAGANREAMAVAHAAGLDFIRAESFVFGHLADEGWMDADAAELLRYRRRIGAETVAVLADVQKKHSSHAVSSDLSLQDWVQAAAFCKADGAILTGAHTGQAADADALKTLRQSTELPLLIGSGVTADNAHAFGEAHGWIVGSSLKHDGDWRQGPDPKRVQRLVEACRSLALFLLFVFAFGAAHAQQAPDAEMETNPSSGWAPAPDSVLLEYQLVGRFSMDSLERLWKKNKVPKSVSPVRYGVRVYELLYWTLWHDGAPVQATGLYFVPEDASGQVPDAPLAVVSFNHGSQITRREGFKLKGEKIITTAMAADGYAGTLPDYVGLGRGGQFHLYHHAATEAQATLDLLRAAQVLNRELGLRWADQLFLSGYSQGGHAALATHKAIEEKHADAFPLVASAPLSGAYDLAGVQSASMFRTYATPGYFPFLMYGMNEAYGLYDDWTEVLRPAYRDTLRLLVESGNHSLREIGRAMPDTPVLVVQSEVVDAYLKDSVFAFREALKANSLTDWAPQHPVMLCYCEADEQVDYRNALVAQKRMEALGAEQVMLRRVGKKFDHRDCAPFAAIYAKLYFDSFRQRADREGFGGKKGRLWPRMLIGLGKWFSPASAP